LDNKKILWKIFGILKYPFTAALLYLVFSHIDFATVTAIIKTLDTKMVAILILISLVKIVLQYNNWRLYLKLFPGIDVSHGQSLLAFLAGTTFKLITPGGVGVYGRMLMLNMRKRDSFLAISYEKIVQSWGMLFWGVIAAAITFSNVNVILRLIVPAVFLTLPLLLFVIPRPSKFIPDTRIPALPPFILQAFIYILTIFQYYLFIKSFTDFSLLKAFGSVPLVQLANTIPITVSGLGLREHFAILVYPPIGVSKELAISCSLFVFMISNVAPAILGVILMLLKPTNKTK